MSVMPPPEYVVPEVNMSDKEKPLPKPPSSPFGRKRRHEKSGEEVPLMADRIAMAQAEGRLGEFLERELPESEHARKLVAMMMGMTGMAQEETLQPPIGEKPLSKVEPDMPAAQPPEDVLNAVHAGDAQALMGLLDREHRKRSPDEKTADGTADAPGMPAAEKPSLEKETIDLLVGIAADNDVSIDWIIMRALRLYIGEYRKTGRL
jgi:hypothetical protein